MKVLQWNILADMYTKVLEPTHLDVLDWNKRMALIVSHIKRVDPNVMFLQEVQSDTHAELLEHLSDYDVAYCPNTDKKGKSAKRTLGVAVLWKKEKYDVLDTLHVLFAKEIAALCNDPQQRNFFANSLPQVLVAVRLCDRGTGDVFCAGSMHIASSRRDPERQFVQVYVGVSRFSEWIGTDRAVLGTDMNIEAVSAGYRLMCGEHVTRVNIFSPTFELPCNGDEFSLSPWKSAHAIHHGREPEVTHTSDHWDSSCDFIWIKGGWSVDEAAIFPDSDSLRENNRAIPTTTFPSDHVLLVAGIIQK